MTNTLRFEWIKLRTLRSTWWALGALLVVTVAIGALVSWATVSHWARMSPLKRVAVDPAFRSMAGMFLAQLVVGALGVVIITSEHASGMIRSTFAAVPRRRQVVLAKQAVVAASILVVGTLASTSAFLLGQAIFSGRGIGIGLASGAGLRVALGGGLFLTLLALLGLGIGVIVRNTAAAISTFAGLVLVLPVLAQALPGSWSRDVSRYLPSNAGQSLLSLHPSGFLLSPWAGLAVLCGWAVLAGGVGHLFVTRRDA